MITAMIVYVLLPLRIYCVHCSIVERESNSLIFHDDDDDAK